MSSKWETFLRIFKLGHTNFWRNRWLTLGATLLMTLTLTMISVSLLLTFLLRDTAESIRSKIDLTLYFRDDTIADNRIVELANRISELPKVIAVEFVDKQKALAIFNRLAINEEIKKPVTSENNPLPRSIQVDTNDPDQIEGLISGIETVDTEKIICNGCASYSQNKETVNRLVSITRFAQRAGLFLSLFFGIIAIFNVLNIIRITIAARSDEIEIMRYVGASNMFVRGPFIIEGILYGLLGTIFTTVFVLAMTYLVSGYLAKGGSSGTSALSLLQIIGTDVYQYTLVHLWLLIGIQLAIGVILGVVVSMFCIRRYLRA